MLANSCPVDFSAKIAPGKWNSELPLLRLVHPVGKIFVRLYLFQRTSRLTGQLLSIGPFAFDCSQLRERRFTLGDTQFAESKRITCDILKAALLCLRELRGNLEEVRLTWRLNSTP